MSNPKSNYIDITSTSKKHNEPHESLNQLLIDTCDNINCKDRNNKTFMELAIENREINIVKILLKRGFDCNIKDSAGVYLLHKAFELSIDGSNEILNLLIDSKDINLDVKYRFYTILQLAISGERLYVARQIIKHKDDCADILEYALLHCKNNQIINMIIDKTKNINSKILQYIFKYRKLDNSYTKDRWCYCDGGHIPNYTIDRIEIIKKLINRGANPFDEDFVKYVLHYARIEVLKLILDLGWDKNSLNKDGKPILNLNDLCIHPKVKEFFNGYKPD